MKDNDMHIIDAFYQYCSATKNDERIDHVSLSLYILKKKNSQMSEYLARIVAQIQMINKCNHIVKIILCSIEVMSK